MKTKPVTMFLFLIFASTHAVAARVSITDLQQQIDNLQTQIDNLQTGEFILTVDCDNGQEPADVLEQNLGPPQLIIKLKGTCSGFRIERDDVVVSGDDDNGCPSATVEGTINVTGQRTLLSCLTVTGPGSGVVAINNASVTIRDSSISGNSQFGVSAAQSTVSVFGSDVSGNTGAGVLATGARIIINTSKVMNNGGLGVELNTNSTADIDQAQINGNANGDLFLSLHSVATGADNTIGVINLQHDSGVLFFGGMVSGPVSCADQESSAIVAGAVPPGCTGF
jgi:hypothetical protein